MDLERLIQAGKTLDNAEVPRKGRIIYDEETDTFMEGDPMDDNLMDDDVLRLECVREAVRSPGSDKDIPALLDKARKIYNFCKEGDTEAEVKISGDDSISGEVVTLE